MKKYVVFDLDNCLSNDEWRIQHINWHAKNLTERYDTYHSLAPFDEPGNMKVLRSWLDHKYDLIILTARAARYDVATQCWLRKYDIPAAMICMRAADDFRPSEVVKREQLISLRIDPSNIAAAFDDRQRTVDMYRALGIERAVRLWIHAAPYAPTRIRIR